MKKTRRIALLPEEVSRRIAAGEVVEGPFSVVKELMENSLDSGATEISLYVEDAGMKLIQVRDNGSGIDPEDMELAVTEHATSKIQDVHDIFQISSYGFRGEALSSIASIADLSIQSRTENSDTGASFTVRNGKNIHGSYAGPLGTQVQVENLFYHVPARKQFLRSRSAESRAIKETFHRIALARPDVKFTFQSDKNTQVSLPAAMSQRDRIAQIYGQDTAERLIEEEITDISLSVQGFLSTPDFLKSNRTFQILYINGRAVNHSSMSFHLSRAYDAIAPPGQHPVAFLFITIDPELVDVNIHPAKREVRFFDPRYIDTIIHSIASKALDREHSLQLSLPESSPVGQRDASEMPAISQQHGSGQQYDIPFSTHRGVDMVRDAGNAVTAHRPSANDDIHIVGVIFSTWLLVEKGDILYFIDFHAAHERILFDEISGKSSVESYTLLFPLKIELTAEEAMAFRESEKSISSAGFSVEPFGESTVLLTAVPEETADFKPEELFREILSTVMNGEMVQNYQQDIYASVACHAARRAGDTLSRNEMELLATQVFKPQQELRCPHGRPFVFTLGKNQLERMFKRS